MKYAEQFFDNQFYKFANDFYITLVTFAKTNETEFEDILNSWGESLSEQIEYLKNNVDACSRILDIMDAEAYGNYDLRSIMLEFVRSYGSGYETIIDSSSTKSNGEENSKDSYVFNINGVHFAQTTAGKERENNEDSFLIATHPNNSDFSIGLVADGVGGNYNGERASRIATEYFAKWFSSLNEDFYNNPEKYVEEIGNAVKTCNYIIATAGLMGAATTLALYVVCKDKVVTITVGDSRVYGLSERGLEQIGVDDSLVRSRFYDNPDFSIKKRRRIKERMRKSPSNNIVTRVLGTDAGGFAVHRDGSMWTMPYQINILDRKDFSQFYAMTDGVVDLISEKHIERFARKYSLAQSIIKLMNKALSPWNFDRGFVPAGKDNIAIVGSYVTDPKTFVKRRKKSGN